MEHHIADINGLRMHYVTHGAGEPILFLHGFPEYWGVWKRQLVELGKDHLVIAPDLRGYNLTSKPEGVEAYRIQHLLEDVRALLEHLGQRKVHLVCQDWGALLGWAFLLHHPERVDHFVSINITHPALFDRELRDNPRQQLASQYMLLFRTPQAEPQIMGGDFAWPRQIVFDDARAHGALLTEEELAEWLAAWRQPGAITAALNYYRAARMGPPDAEGHPGGSNLLEGLAPEQYLVHAPVLLIHGELDGFLLPDGLRGLEKLVTRLTVKRLPDASHWVALEKPREVSQFIRAFLSS